MCGLVGIVDTRERRPVSRELIEAMNQVQHHRGPDETGVHLEPGLGFGHKRLSIIDLSSGQQPIHSVDGRFVMVYNGEVYNFPELREELTQLGHEFRTRCDTEVILYAFAEWGDACVERLRGMFAFALWDRERERLFLARDRLGIKPLYYSELRDGRLAFASELKSLLQIPELNRDLDECAIEEYFTLGYVPEPRSIYRSVKKLAPGYCMAARRAEPLGAPRRYWDVHFDATFHGDEQEASEELITRLRDAVNVRMISDVPLGAFLSGGVDSSAVVAMMAGLSETPVKTCSIAFGDSRYDESDYAEQVATRYATQHSVRTVDPDDFELLDWLGTLYDEPFADSSAIPTYRVCEMARRTVTVALSGDGGDENLAGYRRHRWHMNEERVRSMIPHAIRGPLFGLAGRVYPKLDWAPRVVRAKSTLQALARSPVEAYMHSVSVIPDHIRARMYSAGFKRDLQGYHAKEVFEGHARSASTDDALSLIQYIDLKTYLPGDILTKVDRASMAHALEVRVPLLDHPLVEWMATLPSAVKLNGGEGKYIFKKALAPYLDSGVLYRPKMGFAVPIESWFRGPLRERLREALLGASLTGSGMLDMKYVSRLVEDHTRGISNHTPALWALLMFERFIAREAGGG